MMQRTSVLIGAVLVAVATVRADEGMWPPNAVPTEILRETHGFEATADWIEHLQKSSVRMGASGSLVSRDGLLLTNHHVASDQLFKLSTPERNLLTGAFYARTRDEELRCPDLEVQILWSIEDVTARVLDAGRKASPQAGQSPEAAAHEARRQEMSRIEQESKDAAELDSEVVLLYHGAQYHLYRYRRYTDVRLVMAPEKAVAYFGGDNDNFEYPRFDYDICFFRVYENDAPLCPQHYLKWSRAGAREGDLCIVSGHPGRTRRLLTAEHLAFMRDVDMPGALGSLWRREVQLTVFCNRSPDHLRMGQEDLFSFQNSRKARTGVYAAMLDPGLMQKRQAADAKLREARESQAGSAGDPWERIAAARQAYRAYYPRHIVLSEGRGCNSVLFDMARTIVRLVEELPKPSAERLREYRDSELDSVYLQLYSPAPIHEPLEIDAVASMLSFLAERFGADDPAARAALDGLPPRERAERLVRGCTLTDPENRRKLVQGGREAAAASKDPMIRLARTLDPEGRALRKRYEDQVESVEREAYREIATTALRTGGPRVYPDATGTLRLSFGTIRGYREGKRMIAPFTTMAGLYERARERGPLPPYELPARWLDAKPRVRGSTPLNFVLTADIIGGNSGSPVVNRQGEVVGLIFDSNIAGLIADVAYDDVAARAIAVDVRGIIEGLRTVYDAGPLVDELTR